MADLLIADGFDRMPGRVGCVTAEITPSSDPLIENPKLKIQNEHCRQRYSAC
jgi:hypothetical protein